MIHLRQRSSLLHRKFGIFLQFESIQWNRQFFGQLQKRIISTCNFNVCYASKKPLDYADHLPVYDFGTANLSNKRLYVFGSALCCGLPNMFRPDREDRQRLFTTRPIRNEFCHYNPVYDIAAGHGFTLLATKQHSESSFYLFGCGVNRFSQLGYQSVRPNNPMEMLLSFVPISLPVSRRPKIICMGAGQSHSLVSVKDEGLFSFGDNSVGQCGRFIIPDENYFGSKLIHKVKLDLEPSEDIINISTRFNISVCTTSNGRLFTFGVNNKGQLGRGKLVLGNWIPEQVKGDLEGEKIVSAATSGGSVLCVTEKGELFGWGCNEWGQIDPYNPVSTYYEPRLIKISKSIKIKSVAMGDVFSFILNDQGDVYVWGHGHSLGLGPETRSVRKPTLIPPPLFGRNEFNYDTVVTYLSSSTNYAAAVTSNGDLFTWGENISNCLGLRQQPGIQPFPLKVCLGGSVHKVALGFDHTLVLCKGTV